jgi:hypothetical protein
VWAWHGYGRAVTRLQSRWWWKRVRFQEGDDNHGENNVLAMKKCSLTTNLENPSRSGRAVKLRSNFDLESDKRVSARLAEHMSQHNFYRVRRSCITLTWPSINAATKAWRWPPAMMRGDVSTWPVWDYFTPIFQFFRSTPETPWWCITTNFWRTTLPSLQIHKNAWPRGGLHIHGVGYSKLLWSSGVWKWLHNMKLKYLEWSSLISIRKGIRVNLLIPTHDSWWKKAQQP